MAVTSQRSGPRTPSGLWGQNGPAIEKDCDLMDSDTGPGALEKLTRKHKASITPVRCPLGSWLSGLPLHFPFVAPAPGCSQTPGPGAPSHGDS